MNLTKKQEAEIRKLYGVYWNSYINGDLKTYASLLGEEFKFIGSTEAEPLLNKKDSIAFLEATAAQLRGKAEFRNRNIKVEEVDDVILITELCDGYILIGSEWNFYSRFRLSSLLKKKKEKWKFIHQHVSMPDSKAQEGESYGLEQIRTENIQLRDAVKRRTVELENKNRELEIETALEKVRSRSMAMHKSEEMQGVVDEVFIRLKELEIGLDTANILIFTAGSENVEAWTARSQSNSYSTKFLVPVFSTPHFKMVIDAMAKGQDLVTYQYDFKGKNKWFKYLFKHTDYKYIPDERKQFVLKSPLFTLSVGISKNIGIQLNSYSKKAFTDDENNILRRFTKVFEQAYTRFLDLQKAEAQAKESQVQLALERVRARTMAMHRSDELMETAVVLFDQLKQLGENIERTMIGLMNEEERVVDVWATRPDGSQMVKMLKFPIDEPILMHKVYAAWRQQKKSIVIDLRGEELESYFQFLKGRSARLKRESFGERRVENFAFFSRGFLGVISADPNTPPSVELYERFAAVFEQTYTRFLDLQKAEAQAREAKIEAALERARTQSMLMQHSNELNDTLQVFHQQLQLLGINSDFSYLWLPDEENDKHVFWATWEEQKNNASILKSKTLAYPLDRNDPYTAQCLTDWKSGIPVHSYKLSLPAEVENYFAAWQDLLSGAEKLKAEFFPDGFDYVEAFMKYGCFGIVVSRLLTEDEKQILRRFTIEFERAYTRFLDLQKAEAQGREAQIETALERVRSRSMGMQKSEELKDVIQVVFEQFVHLNIHVEHTGFIMDYKTRDDMHIWLADKNAVPFQVTFPYFDCAHWNSFNEAKEKGIDFFSNQLSFEEKNKFYRDLFKMIPGVPEETLEYYFSCPGLAISTVLLDNVGLYIENFSGISYTDEENVTLMRFGKVFQQTYTRFLDLQKAEAQAREAKIETGLERVRSRSLAMHNTSELQEVIHTVHKELLNLGIAINGGSFIAINRDIDSTLSCWGSGGTADTSEEVHIPLYEKPFCTNLIKRIKKGPGFFTEEYTQQEKKDFFTFLFKHEPWSKLDAKQKKKILSSPGGYTRSCCVSRHTSIFIINHFGEKFSAADNDILQRFGKVFEQTYTRFLDLQKAEAQAREAQIETALEKVRSHTMGMRSSDDLANVATVMFDQMRILGGDLFSFGIVLCNKHENMVEQWHSIPHAGMLAPFFVPVNLDYIHRYRYDQWKAGVELFSVIIPEDYISHHFELMLELPSVKAVWEGIAAKGIPLPAIPTWEIDYGASFKYGYLLVSALKPFEEDKIFPRFAKVFEQAYTRFLDLQKAEAQSREAQIELGLERVRARAMAMQKSDELSELVDTVFKELTKLDFALTWCIINIIDEDSLSNTVWAANPDINKAPESYHMLFEDYPFHHAMMKGWKERRTRDVYVLEGQEKKIYDEYLFNETEFRRVPAAAQAASRAMEKYVVTFSFSNFGGLQTVGDVPLSDASLDILSRFGKVFDLTYTRFNDLKQAEALARESQIQLALERVRARTMAMQKSEELPETSHILFEQMKELGEPVEQLTIGVVQEENKVIEISATLHGDILKKIYQHSLDEPFMMSKIYHAWKTHQKTLIIELKGDELNAYNKYRNELTKSEIFPTNLGDEHRRIVYAAFFSKGMLALGANEPRPPESLQLLERFAGVFDQAYIRFIDLKNAEAQARESQIQLALERVRARTMAMQKSDELAEAASLLFTQIADLGTNSWSSGFIIFQPDELSINSWMSKPDGSMGVPFNIPVTEDPFFIKIYEAYKRGEEFFVMESSGKELVETYKYMFSLPGAAKALGAIEDIGFQMPTFQITHCVFFPTGFLMFITYEPCQEMWEIFRRFGKVFEQTYTRFLDLQKAEAQAREAQIEAALERVRSRAMAMHKTDELLEAAELVSKELSALGITSMNVSYAFVDEEEKYASYYSVNPVDGKVLSFPFIFPHTETDVMRSILSSWKKQEPFNLIELDEEATLKHQTWIGEHIQNLIIKNNSGIPFSVEAFLAVSPKKAVIYTFNFGKGYLFNIGGERLTTMQEEMVLRFTKVFDMTYRRFLDLKHAEAQAREAQIQLAMERVRARTMAMQKSNELPEAANLLFQQVQSLGMPAWSAGYCTWDNDKKTSITLSMSSEGVLQPTLSMPLTRDPSLMHFREAWERGESFFIEEVGGEELKRHYTYLRTLPGVKETLDDIEAAGFPVPTFQIFHLAFFSKGFLLFITYEPVPEAHDIFKRFAKVFEQTYTRFLDLQKAEAQIREAKIEAALEKVRSRTMAMQRSAELAEVATVLFQQVKALGVPQWTCGFGIFEIDDKEFTWYQGSADGELLPPCKIPLTEHPVFIQFNESRKRGDGLYIYEKTGEIQTDHYRYMCSLPGLGKLLQARLDAGIPFPAFQIDHIVNFSHGNLVFITYEHFPEMHDVFKRFAKVFDQTYTRFLDLQKAEAQARDAIKQASVDRIRAEIASMRTTNDLERIQPIIWNELTTLGVPFTRCGVFILDEEQEKVDTFLSTPEGRSIASFTSTYSDLAVISEALPYWRRKEIYKAHWDEATFLAQAKTLLAQGNITSTETYLTEHRPKDLYLHFLPFLQGILYVGNETPLNDEELQLVQNLADAFSIAYARYEDFNKLELAKGQIEKTLVDLKQTQAQLVQSEKMASLGELTAGIAHEIQNPLNFVNNFSDVNKELLVEMKEEIDKGNVEEVKAIANDIIGNEEKINHHGKRADAIVKGMLQHSRSSSGVKEPADINVLADEYLRLAYHGLRAKDKFFNATMKTEYDKSIGKINIVPQDIGRSVLNLITNAFYAVAEKKKQNAEGYEPTVTVTTKRINGRIEIKVADNGNGIPQKVLDKIFQPFFTTKPTGQGTGLGLSLSYDIIKAHGGEINVETKEGEGSEFKISLAV